MKIAITGSTGLVGSSLVTFLEKKGHDVYRLVRSKKNLSQNHIFWNPEKNEIEKEKLEGLDVVIHLAGDSVASGRWTAAKKKSIRDSRVIGTQFLAKTISTLKKTPHTILSASAIGFYGNRGDEILTEESEPGSGFLTEVCLEWEKAWDAVLDKEIRLCFLRIGMVLDKTGGALDKMLLPFKLGLGGVAGNGQQFMSWIALSDLIGAIDFLMRDKKLSGPFNMVGPMPVTNREFTKTLGKVLHRPTFFALPEFVIKTVFGEMGEQLLLTSAHVIPKRLMEAGFQFQWNNLEKYLKNILY